MVVEVSFLLGVDMMHGMGGPMQGLMRAVPQGSDDDMMAGMQGNGEDPTSLLQQAIALHEGHLSGAVPTTPESQQQLMTLLETALSSLTGGV